MQAGGKDARDLSGKTGAFSLWGEKSRKSEQKTREDSHGYGGSLEVYCEETGGSRKKRTRPMNRGKPFSKGRRDERGKKTLWGEPRGGKHFTLQGTSWLGNQGGREKKRGVGQQASSLSATPKPKQTIRKPREKGN